jgi:cytochrome oxidase assembly protein ShyY1
VLRLALHPRWWGWHALLVAVLVSFGWLGWWQLQAWDDTAAPSAPQRSGVVPVADVNGPGERLAPADVGRRVRAEGTWDATGQLLVPGRERGGQEGSLVVTPLRTSAGVLPVVRGFLPSGLPTPEPLAGSVTVTGVAQPSETEADAAVEPGASGAGTVDYLATVTLLDALPYEPGELYDGYVVLRSQRPADSTGLLAAGVPERVGESGAVGRWRNLAYGLQWWLFAGAAVVLWASVLRRAATPGPVPEPPGDEDRRPPVAPRRTT